MRRLNLVLALCLGAMLVSPALLHAQFRDWMTAGADAQRSSWIRTDPKISVGRMAKPGFDLVWKIKLSQEPGAAATLSRYIGYRGFRTLALMGSRSGEITAIDSDLGRIEWSKSIPVGPAGATAAGCPDGMSAEVTRATVAVMPGMQPGRGNIYLGRSGPAKSAVGEPGQGAVIIQEIAAREAMLASIARTADPPPPPPPASKRMPAFLDVLSADGMLHRLYVSNGEEPAPPIPFLDRNANATGFTVIDNFAYVATSRGCGGIPNGVRALDLTSKETAHWTTDGDLAGEEGPAFGSDGTLYVATSTGELVALQTKTLQVKASYHSGGPGFITSPMVFAHKMQVLVAAATSDNRLHLVDAQSLSGTGHPATISGAMAGWTDAQGTQWIAAPSKDSVAAWNVVDQGDAPAVQPGWTSREMAAPLAPMVINGVIFVVSNGTTPVLYALDATTGKELWNSGKTITDRVRNGRLTGSDSQLYLGTSDGTLYSFGFPIEH
jgi:outer membrane protein assembly factor BamB